MKKGFYLLALLLMGALTTLSSCGDDDDIIGDDGQTENPDDNNDPKEDVKSATIDATAYDKWVYFKFSDGSSASHEIEPIGGTYNGDMGITVGGKDQGTVNDLKLEVNRVNKDSVNIVLKDFKFGSYDMGDISTGATVSVDSLGWQLSALEAVVNGNVKISAKGTITGTTLKMDVSLQPGMMPMVISANYDGTIETSANIDETSFDWDIAFHSYDKKTNGGSILETAETELSNVKAIPEGDYTADITTDSLLYDMTGMMDNAIGYASGSINEVLMKSTTRDLSNMPPAYTKSDRVYIVKTKAGEYAKIKFTDDQSDEGKRGVFTFDYVFPIK